MDFFKQRSTLGLVGSYLFAVFIAACTYRVLTIMLAAHVDDLANNSYMVTLGKPEWIAHQNRLLAPYSILAISKLGMSYVKAWKIFAGLLLIVECVLLTYILRKQLGRSLDTAKHLVLFMFCFLLLPNGLYLSWDMIELVVFTLFAFSVLNPQSTTFNVVLFVVALANRESALVIAVWIILDSFALSAKPISMRLVNRSKAVLGSILLVVCVIYVKWVRDALFVSQPNGSLDVEHVTLGNHATNFEFNLAGIFLVNVLSTDWVISVLILGPLVFFVSRIRRLNDGELKCLLVLIMMLLSIMIFGAFYETRIHIILLPFGYLLWLRIITRNLGQGHDRVADQLVA